MTPELVRQFFKVYGNGTSNFCNFYGSTEMMDVTFASFSSIDDLESQLDSFGKVPIGEPVFNSSSYVLDESMQLVSQGTIGQLYVASSRVGKPQNLKFALKKTSNGNDEFATNVVFKEVLLHR